MPDIFIESNPTEERLEQLGVRSWPIWSKEASEFPWTYNEPETCYLVFILKRPFFLLAASVFTIIRQRIDIRLLIIA
jgi:hypothetical protein